MQVRRERATPVRSRNHQAPKKMTLVRMTSPLAPKNLIDLFFETTYKICRDHLIVKPPLRL